jgi:hypothetical protein
MAQSNEVELEVLSGKKITFNPDSYRGTKALLKEYERQAQYAVRDWNIRGMDESDKMQLLRIQTIEAARYWAVRELGRIQDVKGEIVRNRASYDKLRKLQWDNVLKEEQRKRNRTIKRGSRVIEVSLDQPLVETEGHKLTLHDVIEGHKIKTCDEWTCSTIEELQELERKIAEGCVPLDEQESIKQKLMNFVAWSGPSHQLYEFKRDTDLLAKRINDRLGCVYQEVFLLKRAGLSQKSIANLMRLKKKTKANSLRKDSSVMISGKVFDVVEVSESVRLKSRDDEHELVVLANDMIEIEKNRTEGSISQLVEILKKEQVLQNFFIKS